MGIEYVGPSRVPAIIPEIFDGYSILEELTLSSSKMGVSTQIITIFSGGIMIIPEKFLAAPLKGWGAHFCLAGWKKLETVDAEGIGMKRIAVIDIPTETSAEWSDLADTKTVRSTSVVVGKWLVLQQESDLTRAIRDGPIGKLVDGIVTGAGGAQLPIHLYQPDKEAIPMLRFPAIVYASDLELEDC